LARSFGLSIAKGDRQSIAILINLFSFLQFGIDNEIVSTVNISVFKQNTMKEQAITQINNQLDDLAVDGTFRFGLNDFIEDSDASEEYSSTCKALVETLRYHDERVGFSANGTSSSLVDIYKAIEPRKPHFQEVADHLKYRILSYLCTNLQVN
jgi:hypothetical protein